MSKLIDNIRIELTGKQSQTRFIPLTIKQKIDEPLQCESPRLYEYSAEVRLGYHGLCHKDELRYLKEQFINEVREELYGDLRKPLIELERAIYNEDREALKEALDKVKKEIWG